VRFSLQPGSLFACTLAISAASGNTLFEAGYSQMYNIQFADAPRTFQEWEGAHPNDPMGPVSDAAAYLFSEFDRLRIPQAELFVDNLSYFGMEKVSADPAVKRHFGAALARTR